MVTQNKKINLRDTREEKIDEVSGDVSLKYVPLEERRREAKKPLYLTRYE